MRMRLNDDKANVWRLRPWSTWRLEPETPREIRSGPVVPTTLRTPLEMEADMNCRPSSGSKIGADERAARAVFREVRSDRIAVSSAGLQQCLVGRRWAGTARSRCRLRTWGRYGRP